MHAHTHTHTHTHTPRLKTLIYTHIGLHHLNAHTQKHVELYSYAKLYFHTSSIPFFIETRRLYKFRDVPLKKASLPPHWFHRCKIPSVADAGFKERGGCSGGGSPKGGGCGRGMCPLPREARKLLKTLIRCAKMHEKITSFCYLCRILRIM